MMLAVVAFVGIVVGGTIAYAVLRGRRPDSIEDNLRNFQRGLDALDPANDPLRERERARKNRS